MFITFKAPGRGGVINGQLKTLVKSSNVPLFGAMVLHVAVNFFKSHVALETKIIHQTPLHFPIFFENKIYLCICQTTQGPS